MGPRPIWNTRWQKLWKDLTGIQIPRSGVWPTSASQPTGRLASGTSCRCLSAYYNNTREKYLSTYYKESEGRKCFSTYYEESKGEKCLSTYHANLKSEKSASQFITKKLRRKYVSQLTIQETQAQRKLPLNLLQQN